MYDYSFYIWPSLVAALLSTAIALVALTRREATGVIIFALMMGLAAVWSLGIGLSNAARGFEQSLFWFNVAQLGTALMPPLVFLFARSVASPDQPCGWRHTPLFIIPFLTHVWIWIVPWPNLLRTGVELIEAPWFSYINTSGGPWLAVETVYSYGLVLAAMVILALHARQRSRPAQIILLALLIPVASSALNGFGVNPLRPFGAASTTFTLAGIIILFGVFRHGLLNVVPVAHAQVLAALADPVIVVNTENIVIDANVAAGELSPGVPILGRVATEALPFLQGAESDQDLTVTTGALRKVMHLLVVGWKASNGREAGRVFVLHDVTTRRRMEGELREANAALTAASQRAADAATAAERANQAKSDFLAAVSHEIRTPMNGVVSIANLLLKSDLPPEQRGFVEILANSGEALMNVVDDILDFAKIESRTAVVHAAPFDLYATVRDVATLTTSRFRNDEVAFAVSVDPNVPAALIGDGGRVRQVLLNLVNNAFRFTRAGEVSLHVAVAGPDSDQDAAPATVGERVNLLFAVTDTGVGIPADQLQRIFHPFHQPTHAPVRLIEGTSLGLAISQQLVQLMQGAIAVSSEVGKGSRFEVRIPFLRDSTAVAAALPIEPVPVRRNPAATVAAAHPLASPSDATAEPASVPTAPTAGASEVLLVEDNELNRRVALSILRSIGRPADYVVNGAEAIERLKTGRYAVVLMDCQMPEMDGFEATRRIRAGDAGERNRRIPIIALTAHALPGDRERCFASGMDDYLTKPVKPVDLDRVLEQWLAGDSNVFDVEAFLNRLMGDRAVARDVIQMFLDTIPRRIEEIRAARDAQDAGGIAARAHSIKGAAANIGANHLRDAATALEQTVRVDGLVVAEARLRDLARAFDQLERPLRESLRRFADA